MANNDSTVTPEQLAKQYPDNSDPFGVWYCIDAERDKWAVNDENGDGFTEALNYETALILSDALRIRHEKINPEGLKAVTNRLEYITLDIMAMHELLLDTAAVKPSHCHTILQTMTRACAIDVNNCLKALGGDDNGFVEAKLGTL